VTVLSEISLISQLVVLKFGIARGADNQGT
jgi:hypothetical protein